MPCSCRSYQRRLGQVSPAALQRMARVSREVPEYGAERHLKDRAVGGVKAIAVARSHGIKRRFVVTLHHSIHDYSELSLSITCQIVYVGSPETAWMPCSERYGEGTFENHSGNESRRSCPLITFLAPENLSCQVSCRGFVTTESNRTPHLSWSLACQERSQPWSISLDVKIH